MASDLCISRLCAVMLQHTENRIIQEEGCSLLEMLVCNGEDLRSTPHCGAGLSLRGLVGDFL